MTAAEAMDDVPTILSFEPKLFTNHSKKKPLSVSELYKQLKKLSKELNGLEQETVETQSLDKVTQQLLEPTLLRHKEKGVVAYVSCCIADILRLYAPEAPYSDRQIKDIFNVFIDQLQLLEDANQFLPLREYLLTSLATVRTPALVAMLPDPEDIISRFFTVLFGVVSPELPHNLQMHILDVLQQLLEEPKTVPQEVVDVILLQFTQKRQQDNPAAHQLASDLANAASDVLQKYIYQYFNDVIVSAAQQRAGQREAEDEDEDEGEGMSGSLNDLRSAHFLILELNKVAPGILLNVIPQVQEELGVDDTDIRVLATGVLGQMFAEKGFTLAKRYDATWKQWKGRRADASPLVRIEWVEHAVSLYQHQPQLARELNQYVKEKLCDVDEKVRKTTCHVLGLLEMSASVQSAMASEVVDALGERCKDRKAGVRSEAIIALANMYSQVYEELEQGNTVARAKWGSIPSNIYMLRYVNDPDVDSKVESILTGAILNFNKIKDDRSRCNRLLVVFESLSEKAKSGFYSYMKRQQGIIQLTQAFLRLCDEQQPDAENGLEPQLQVLATKISGSFPDKAKLEQSLLQLAELHNGDIYKGLLETMDAKNDIKAVRKQQKGSLKKLSTLSPALLETTAPLWKCVGLTTINRALVPYLMEQTSSSPVAEKLLEFITEVFPEMIKYSSAELFSVEGLAETKDQQDSAAVDERLSLMAKFCQQTSKSVPRSSELEHQLIHFVRNGNLRQARDSAYLLTQMVGGQALCVLLTGDMVDNLDNKHLENRAPSFAALSQFAQYASSTFNTYSEQVSKYLVQDVLMHTVEEEDKENKNVDEDEWTETEDLDDITLTKVYAIRILANWMVGLERESLNKDNVQMVFGALRQLLRNEGEIQPGMGSRQVDRQHCLLTAASCMVKLAKVPHFQRVINAADVLSIALVVQNPCYGVRSAFLLQELIPALVARQIHVRFVPALFLVAHDPEQAPRDNVRHAVSQRLSHMRPSAGSPSVVESSLCGLLYILAHHPDWDSADMLETMNLSARYIEYYIQCVGGSQNVSLLFCYAGELKAYQNRPQSDGINSGIDNEGFNRRLYQLSELAQYLLRERSLAANWPVNVYPGQLELQKDVFVALTEAEKREVPRGPWLDPEFVRQRSKTTTIHRGGRVAKKEETGGKRKRPPARKGKEPEDVEMSDGDQDQD